MSERMTEERREVLEAEVDLLEMCVGPRPEGDVREAGTMLGEAIEEIHRCWGAMRNAQKRIAAAQEKMRQRAAPDPTGAEFYEGTESAYDDALRILREEWADG